MTATDNIIHERYCTPRPDADTARTETFSTPRTGPDGVRVISYATVTRCQECAAQTVDGVPVDG